MMQGLHVYTNRENLLAEDMQPEDKHRISLWKVLWSIVACSKVDTSARDLHMYVVSQAIV